MGQQQLLLLVLGIVIVGLAVVVGIQAFSENQKKANADAMVMDGLRIASDTQAWMLKPVAFGGGGNVLANWNGLEFSDLGYEENASSKYVNLNGTYTLTGSATDVKIQGESATGSSGDNNLICVVITGTRPTDISTTILSMSADSSCP